MTLSTYHLVNSSTFLPLQPMPTTSIRPEDVPAAVTV